ncbi:MAG: glycosyltransferase [Halodesulfurarchaeum sp.]|nr:glycosyltransferase [Halodesulfurarchaeum sp.]
MDLSVVIPTLNGRAELPATLGAIAEHLSDVEVIVANGPSADGTSGFVCEHEAVDVLLELSERNPNVARNAGLAAASGDAIAFLDQATQVESSWRRSVETALAAGADAVTGPVHRELGADVTTESLEEAQIGSRTVRFFDGGNVVFSREAITSLDGFDEHLAVGAARDLAHRLAGQNRTLRWEPGATVLRSTAEPTQQDESATRRHALEYRSQGYRVAKNYGLGWKSGRKLIGQLSRGGFSEAKSVMVGDVKPSLWFTNGREAVTQVLQGVKEGLTARLTDRSTRRNPHGLSARQNRPVSRCEP